MKKKFDKVFVDKFVDLIKTKSDWEHVIIGKIKYEICPVGENQNNREVMGIWNWYSQIRSGSDCIKLSSNPLQYDSRDKNFDEEIIIFKRNYGKQIEEYRKKIKPRDFNDFHIIFGIKKFNVNLLFTTDLGLTKAIDLNFIKDVLKYNENIKVINQNNPII